MRYSDTLYTTLVLISEKHDGSLVARRVTDVHNGGNALELDRVRQTHPGENECVLNSRVLGFLAPTRGMSRSPRSCSPFPHFRPPPRLYAGI